MTETKLYIVRHGKTMFNTIGRTQGWSDTPLTKEGVEIIHYLGKGLKEIPFINAYSSDSGRAMQTAQIILGEHPAGSTIPYQTDARIREWCFGSLDGGYNGELWGVVPRILAFKNYDEMMTHHITYKELANAIIEADTANWAEPYSKIHERVWEGFKNIAHQTEKNGGGNTLVVSHGLTISFLLSLIDSTLPMQISLENGSVTTLLYAKDRFTIDKVNNIQYIKNGKKQHD
ncbi:histidine phosphatase family protein [Melissococcus plutonius]|uniref:Phosphoglycerate mutase family protein n=2 Tax=Melissococcus plutonius TaxID=33970 RepID=F3YB18_MELPT|nr:histidine phosphatase family protein [Melissococcus plutonius]BAL61955.1 phosphoglycerate mutase family protein [Melissococcus plutonius DAT561]KMT31140.1 phosphoglycerate mutase family protein [Melissococcus plutonius]KMT33838.1 phosphoglycerate mutase family protein [Melissococcus plutonius]KMT39789.1 phosphoglycerate mutase family protein [Melissococcus plutonius]MBB5178503.1 putative phosphoglycerate mutase [Melissococcus plutonius]